MLVSYNKYLDHNYSVDSKRHASISNIRIKCKNCGHSLCVTATDRVICTHCGLWVYKDDKTEFKYKMKEKIAKNEKK